MFNFMNLGFLTLALASGVLLQGTGAVPVTPTQPTGELQRSSVMDFDTTTLGEKDKDKNESAIGDDQAAYKSPVQRQSTVSHVRKNRNKKKVNQGFVNPDLIFGVSVVGLGGLWRLSSLKKTSHKVQLSKTWTNIKPEKLNILPFVLKDGSTLPIVYDYRYGCADMSHLPCEKYGNIYRSLCNLFGVPEIKEFTSLNLPPDEDLLLVHTAEYINETLKSDKKVDEFMEMHGQLIGKLPEYLAEHCINAQLIAIPGTVYATELAIKYGAAVNLAGGMHHAMARMGEGFCLLNDIAIAVYKILQKYPDYKILVVDLDNHMGNGFETIFYNKETKLGFTGTKKRIFTFDMFAGPTEKEVGAGDFYSGEKKLGSWCYPGHYYDEFKAKHVIDYMFPLYCRPYTTTDIYLRVLTTNLPKALDECKPNFILYNAGSDIYEEDPTGRLSVSAKGIIDRDEFVFRSAVDRKIPICMLLAGGYAENRDGKVYKQENHTIVANSIFNLHNKGLIKPVK